MFFMNMNTLRTQDKYLLYQKKKIRKNIFVADA